jgi:hypothetical protein
VGSGIVAAGHPLFQNQSALQTLLDGGGQGQAAMVGLHSTAGYQRIGPLSQGFGNQKLQLSGFVTAAGQSQQIVSFHVNGRASQGC